MASERDLELLDDYIGNRLNAQDRGAFEQQLNADPSLQSELQFQNRIADGLRTARAAELKAMLGAIPTTGLPHGGETSLVAKVGMWVAASAVVGTGIYYYLTNTDAPEQAKTDEIVQGPSTTTPTPAPGPKSEDAVNVTPKASDEQKTVQPIVKAPTKDAVKPIAPIEQKKADSSSGVKSPTKPVIDAFNPAEETEEGTSSGQSDIEAKAKANAIDIPVENDNSNKKYKFHYQIKDGKLTLYGPFEQTVYEVMALYSGSKVTRFLYRQDKYYLLSDENETVKPLSPINDPKLIDKLNKSRQKEN